MISTLQASRLTYNLEEKHKPVENHEFDRGELLRTERSQAVHKILNFDFLIYQSIIQIDVYCFVEFGSTFYYWML